MKEDGISYIDVTGIEDKREDWISYKDYNIKDCVLIRITDIFPKDGIVQTLAVEKCMVL